MACSDYAGIIKEALDEDLVQNWGNINLNLSNYNNKDSEGEHKDSENLNILCGIVKWSLSGMLINGWSPTFILGVLTPLIPLIPL